MMIVTDVVTAIISTTATTPPTIAPAIIMERNGFGSSFVHNLQIVTNGWSDNGGGNGSRIVSGSSCINVHKNY